MSRGVSLLTFEEGPQQGRVFARSSAPDFRRFGSPEPQLLRSNLISPLPTLADLGDNGGAKRGELV